MSATTLLLLCGALRAETLPEVALVGLHTAGVAAADARAAILALQDSLEATGRVRLVPPDEVARRIDGREAIILGDAFLGPARAQLEEGRVLYERADPDQAVPVLEEAIKAFNASMGSATDLRPMLDALLLLGFAHLVSGDEEHAREAFARVVQLDPARELDEVNYAPRIVNLYAEVRAQVLAQGTGSIEVVTELPGAEVFVDGRSIGTTPVLAQGLPAGRHYLGVLGHGGFRSFGVVEVAAGQRGVARVGLEQRALARPEADARGRARQTEQLYRSLGEYLEADAILLGGVEEEGELSLQLYTARTGAFSKPLRADTGGAPYDAAADLAPALIAYLNPTGELRADKVGASVLALDASANDLLAELLLDPQPKWEIVEERSAGRWYLWAGAGVLAAGGATALTAVLIGGAEARGNQGTIVVEIP